MPIANQSSLTLLNYGKCPVQIHYRNDNASCQLRLGEAWQVTLHDDLLRDLRGLLQPENVKVVYA
jgi:DNA polymerase-3 subunit alpha